MPRPISRSTSPPPHPSPSCPTATTTVPDAQGLLVGTNPHDPANFFRVSKIEKSATGTQLQFGTAACKTYRIEYTDDLKTPWQLLKDNIPGTGDPVTIPDPSAKTILQRFYRLVVVVGQ